MDSHTINIDYAEMLPCPPSLPMSEPVENLRIAYQILERNVIRALRTQRGDSAQLTIQANEALQLLQAAEPASDLFIFSCAHSQPDPSTVACLRLQNMLPCSRVLQRWSMSLIRCVSSTLRCLSLLIIIQARHLSSDAPDGPRLIVTHRVATGGRPRIEIDPQVLQEALNLRGTTHLAALFNCAPRTIRRRALEYGLVEPGAPVYTDTPRTDGTIVRTYASTSRPVSVLTDEELDTVLTSILEVFPDFGRRMLIGRLKAAGHHVPRARIAASYLRVHGSPGRFGVRFIHRRPYNVAGANSLWHHDGQHGMSPSYLFACV
jgi:hypothetical protein